MFSVIIIQLKNWLIRKLGGRIDTVTPDPIDVDEEKPQTFLQNEYLFDFKNFSKVYNKTFGNEEESNNLKKVHKAPRDALSEFICKHDEPFNMNQLDEKLINLSNRYELLVERYAKKETQALIERLENRKKFRGRVKKFYSGYQHTTQQLVDRVLLKYFLVLKPADICIPEFPDEAIQLMKVYTQQTVMLCGKKPVFYVLIDESDLPNGEHKRDPVLLVQSPFGFFWQILGVFECNIIIISEL